MNKTTTMETPPPEQLEPEAQYPDNEPIKQKLLRYLRKANQAVRMWQWWLLAIVATSIIAYVAPHKLGTTLYAVSLLTIAFIAGYWGDRTAFTSARPDMPLKGAHECMAHGANMASEARSIMESVMPGDKKAVQEAEIQAAFYNASATVSRDEGLRLLYVACAYQLRRALIISACIIGLLNRL